MKKLVILALATFCTFNVFAAQVLVETKAKSVESSTKDPNHKEARECTYSLVYRSNDKSDLTLFLNSDEDSGIDGYAYVNKVKLPLTEGDNASGWDNVKIVKKGSIVTITEKREAAGYGSLYDVLTLDVSADLKMIKSGRYQSFMTNLFGVKKLQEELNCEF